MYKVILVEAGCGGVLNVSLIEKNANTTAEKGYELVQMYQSSSAGCGGPKTAAVMVFRQR